MKKFNEFVVLKEADQAQEIDAVFKKAEDDINSLFDQLYKGAERMVNTAKGSSGVSPQLIQSILNDLQIIANKFKNKTEPAYIMPDLKRVYNAVKGMGGPVSKSVMADPANPNRIPVTAHENVMVPTLINDIINEISAVSGLTALRQNNGMNVYNLKDALNNVKQKIMGRMQELRKTIENGILGQILRNTTSRISGSAQSNAKYHLQDIANAIANTGFKIIANGQELNINPNDENSIIDALKNIDPRHVTVRMGDHEEEVDLTHDQQVADMVTKIDGEKERFVAKKTDGRKLRSLKLR